RRGPEGQPRVRRTTPRAASAQCASAQCAELVGIWAKSNRNRYSSGAERIEQRLSARRAVARAGVPGAATGAIGPVSARRDVVVDRAVEPVQQGIEEARTSPEVLVELADQGGPP